MRTALLDGDTFVYTAATNSEYETQWDENIWTLHSDLKEAMQKFDTMVQGVVDALEPDALIFALSDPLRFRPRVMPTYKSNRTSRKPIVYQPLREYVMETRRTYMKPWLEGDDVLGILATHPGLVKGEKVVVSIDKDLLTVPGFHTNYVKAPRDIREVTEEEADYNWMMQVLTGDRSDGYSGCPGIGPVRAAKLINIGMDLDEMWDVVVAQYRKAGLGEELALQTAQVARILRAEDYNFETQEPILWKP